MDIFRMEYFICVTVYCNDILCIDLSTLKVMTALELNKEPSKWQSEACFLRVAE